MKPLPNLIMRQILSVFDSGFAALHGFNKTGIFLKRARDHFLYQLVWVAALLCGAAGKFGLEFRRKMHFH